MDKRRWSEDSSMLVQYTPIFEHWWISVIVHSKVANQIFFVIFFNHATYSHVLIYLSVGQIYVIESNLLKVKNGHMYWQALKQCNLSVIAAGKCFGLVTDHIYMYLSSYNIMIRRIWLPILFVILKHCYLICTLHFIFIFFVLFLNC